MMNIFRGFCGPSTGFSKFTSLSENLVLQMYCALTEQLVTATISKKKPPRLQKGPVVHLGWTPLVQPVGNLCQTRGNSAGPTCTFFFFPLFAFCFASSAPASRWLIESWIVVMELTTSWCNTEFNIRSMLMMYAASLSHSFLLFACSMNEIFFFPSSPSFFLARLDDVCDMAVCAEKCHAQDFFQTGYLSTTRGTLFSSSSSCP